MLDKLTKESFAEHLGTKFRLELEGVGTLELELAEIIPYAPSPGRKREPFSLLLRGPRQMVLPQRIYRLEHETMGTLEIFLVPIGPDEVGMRYEAAFN